MFQNFSDALRCHSHSFGNLLLCVARQAPGPPVRRAARIKAEGTPRTDISECLKKATTGREGLLVIGIDDQEGAAVIPAELLSLRRQGLENNAVLDGYVSVCRQTLEYVLNACTYGETKVTEFSVRTENKSKRCSITLDWRSGQEWKLSYLFSGPDDAEGETE